MDKRERLSASSLSREEVTLTHYVDRQLVSQQGA